MHGAASTSAVSFRRCALFGGQRRGDGRARPATASCARAVGQRALEVAALALQQRGPRRRDALRAQRLLVAQALERGLPLVADAAEEVGRVVAGGEGDDPPPQVLRCAASGRDRPSPPPPAAPSTSWRRASNSAAGRGAGTGARRRRAPARSFETSSAAAGVPRAAQARLDLLQPRAARRRRRRPPESAASRCVGALALALEGGRALVEARPCRGTPEAWRRPAGARARRCAPPRARDRARRRRARSPRAACRG